MTKNINQTRTLVAISVAACMGLGTVLAGWGAIDEIPKLGFSGAALMGAALIPIFSFQRLLFVNQPPLREMQILIVGIIVALFGLSLLSTSHQAAALACIASSLPFVFVAKKMKQRRIGA